MHAPAYPTVPTGRSYHMLHFGCLVWRVGEGITRNTPQHSTARLIIALLHAHPTATNCCCMPQLCGLSKTTKLPLSPQLLQHQGYDCCSPEPAQTQPPWQQQQQRRWARRERKHPGAPSGACSTADRQTHIHTHTLTHTHSLSMVRHPFGDCP